MSIWKFLGLGTEEDEGARGAASAETETVRKIVGALERLEPERARYLAAFAFNLSRVAYADRDISEAETRAMERILMEKGGLPEAQAILAVQMAKTQSLLFSGTENFLVTREFNRIATPEQKLALVDCLFAVSAADKSISTVEDNEIRQICKEMLLSHSDFIAVRLRYKDHLASKRAAE